MSVNRPGRMPPIYDNRPPAPSPYEALGRRIALLEERVKALEAQLAEQDDSTAKPPRRTTTKQS